MSIKKYPEVVISTFRAGYGHIRGALAVLDQLKEIGIKAELIDIGKETGFWLRSYLGILNWGFDMSYRYFPKLFLKVTRQVGPKSMRLMAVVGSLIDKGGLEKSLVGVKVHIAAHMTPAELTTKIPTILLALDPYPPFYNVDNSNVVTLTPDEPTASGLDKIGQRMLLVTGPIVAKPIIEARKRFEKRKKELEGGAGLRVTIATGGSLTHGREIILLTKAYLEAMKRGEKIEKLNIVIGDSKMMKVGAELLLKGEEMKNRINVIFDQDEVKLVRMADEAMGESDVVSAKTGELVYIVAGGKVFETFNENPSLAIQEVKLKDYVLNKTTTDLGNNRTISALEIGSEAEDEVKKILKQLKDGILIKRMEAGLKVPPNGAVYAAQLAKEILDKNIFKD